MSTPFNLGQQFLYDNIQRFTEAGLPVFLRVKNFTETLPQDDSTFTDYLEVGVPFSPTGGQEVGTSDIPILPPPFVHDVSLANIGLLAGRLNFGSRIFKISDTWVQQQMAQYSIADPYDVFRDRDGHKTVGIFYNNRLFAIESLTHREAAGVTISWIVVGNALELQSPTTG